LNREESSTWQTSINGGSSNSSTFDPELAHPIWVYNGTEYYITYTVTNSAGCQGYADASLDYNDAPEVIVTPTASSCQSADGSALATITGQAAPFDVYWTTGLTEQVSSSSTINNLSSGVYYINVEDQNGCKAVGQANIHDGDLSVTPTVTPQYCAGGTGEVDLAITPGTGTVDEIFWSNGNTTSTLVAPAGTYTVQVHTTSNCNYYGTYVIPDSSLRVEVDSYDANYNCATTPNGYINVSTYGGQGAYTWAWTKDMSPYASSEDISGIEGAWYECTVQDASGCSLNWGKMIENYSNNSVWVYEITPATCGNQDGGIDMNVDTIWGDVPTFYEWNTGATSEDLNGIAAGSYTLTHTDQSGCTSKIRVEVPNEKPYQPEICLLTVDTTYTYNQVIWEKIPAFPVDGFNIYRETPVFGQFEKVHSQAYAIESFYVDNAASPIDRSWRYYMTTYDACGNESEASFIHKTIHIVATDAGGGSFNVSWDKYEGLDYTDVDLYRFTESTGWEFVDNFGLTELSTIDTPPNTVGLDYMVEFNLTDGCSTSKAQDYNSSRSNTTSGVWNPGEDILSVEDADLGLIQVYPNPTNGLVTVYVENPDEFEMIQVRDVNGQLVYSDLLTKNYSDISLDALANGMYFISFVSQDKVINEKILKK
jgi:hypothetical protein